MSHESVPLAYATPVQTSLSAPVRWTLIAWAGLVLLRHFFYWSRMGFQNFRSMQSIFDVRLNLSPTTVSFTAFVIEAIGLTLILIGALDRKGGSNAMRKLAVGSTFVLIALIISIVMIVFNWANRRIPTDVRTVFTSLWQIASALAASSPVLLAWLTFREHRSAMNRVAT